MPADLPSDEVAVLGSEGSEGSVHEVRRTWPQRALLAVNCLVILSCFAAAAGLLIGRHYGNSLIRVELEDQSDATPNSTVGGPVPEGGQPDVSSDPAAPGETFPAVDPGALNFLITGADNNACIQPGSPYAAAFGDRDSLGERSDTIMIMRVDAQQHLAAVLSFPRDLWVDIPGRGKSRINAAYARDDPQKLIDTIFTNFGVGVDHFIQVDFCAFKTIVDELGGVAVPFEYPARDEHTGLFVPEPGCFTFDGDHALAYVRSRYYEYMDESGRWKADGTSDLGRISRQQDFIRRVMTAAKKKGFDPGVARGLIEAVRDYVVFDTRLTPSRLLEFAGTLSAFEPGTVSTYQVESRTAVVNDSSVQLPVIEGENMQSILDVFRAEAPLTAAPEQVFETTTTVADGSTSTSLADTGTTMQPADPTAPLQDTIGQVPPADRQC